MKHLTKYLVIFRSIPSYGEGHGSFRNITFEAESKDKVLEQFNQWVKVRELDNFKHDLHYNYELVNIINLEE